MSMVFTDFLRKLFRPETRMGRNSVPFFQEFVRSEALIEKVMVLPETKVGV